jgi:FkbM family methyltransferase
MFDFLRRIALQSFKQMGLEVRRARKHPGLIDFIEDRRVRIVYDVGANVGQFGLGLQRRGYAARIVTFEPVQSAYDSLKEVAHADGNWEALRCAIGCERGEISINVSANTQFSSIKSLSCKAASIDPQSGIVGCETVFVETLDTLPEPVEPILIKIDTQGFEREVLSGAKIALRHAAGVLMELPIISVYESSWSFLEAVRTMDGLGFVPCQVDPVNHHHADPMAAVEFDCLFRRKGDYDSS